MVPPLPPSQASAIDHIRVLILPRSWPEQPEWLPQPCSTTNINYYEGWHDHAWWELEWLWITDKRVAGQHFQLYLWMHYAGNWVLYLPVGPLMILSSIRLPWGKDRQRASMLTRRWSIIWQYIRCNCVANSQVVPYFFVWILNSLQLSLSRVYTLELINSCFCSVTTFFTSCCFEVAISYMLLSYSIYYTKPYCCLSTCKLYVTDYITYKVWVMSASGEIITTFGGEHLSNPEGITIKFWFMCFILSMQSM